MKSFKKFASMFLAGAMIAGSILGLTSCGETNYAENNTEFYIGASGPLTGGAAAYGLAVKNAAEMAVNEINAKGGVTLKNGEKVKLKFVMMDDKHDASLVSANYTTMYEAGMQMSLGCVTTKPCLEFKALSQEDSVFFITPSASADAVVEYDNAYQMCFADNKQGVAAGNYVKDNCASQKVGVLYRSDDPYSTGIWNEFKSTVGNSISVTEASFVGDTVTSFASQITTLKDCDFIFMPIYYGPAAQFMTEGKGTIKAGAVYYGCDGLDGIDTAVDGFDINTIPQEVSFLSHFNSKATEGAAADFIASYVAAYGADTLNQFGASAYDCVYAIKAALEQTDLAANSSPADCCEALQGVFQSEGFTFSGVTGSSITWDENGFVQKGAVKYVVKSAD